MKLHLEGRNCIVLGGSRGIGRAIALGFAPEGANVAICARSEEPLRATEAALLELGVRAYADMCDVADPAALAAFLNAARRALGGVDVLVHNASAFAVGADPEQRFTAFRSDGSVRATQRFDGYLWPALGHDDSTIAAVVGTLASGYRERRDAQVVWFHPRTGIVRRQRLSLPDTAAPRLLVRGAWSPDGGFVFTTFPYRLVRFSADGRYLGQLTPAHYQPELPNDRDVEQHAAAMWGIFRTKPDAADLRSFRETPKNGLFRVSHGSR